MAGVKVLERHPNLSGSSNRGSVSLLDLPLSAILHIAEFLPCNDLPSLVCTCKELSSMARAFYGERRVLDMRCFEVVTPKLCGQLVERFSASSLEKCIFRCNVSSSASSLTSLSSSPTEQAIIERFLDNYCCDEELVRDLHSHFSPSMCEWFSDSPRPIDVLAHCYYLEMMLSSQSALKELIIDVEFSIFRVPKSKGFRHHWHLMQPFLALQVIQKKCPLLERYIADKVRYQSSTLDLQHLQLRFLQNSTKLKFLGVRFGLDKGSLESYEHIKGPLALEKAVFLLNNQHLPDQNPPLSRARMQSVATKMQKLRNVAIIFNRRGALRQCSDLLLNLPCLRSLCLKCDFNPGYPSFDIDEGMENGLFFGGFWSVVPSSVNKLSLLDVPEDEFMLLFDDANCRMPEFLRHLRVRFVWSSNDKLGEDQVTMITKVSKHWSHLETFNIEVYSCNGGAQIFSKTCQYRKG